jgi:lipopolysaccharide/colanic/teichoic acid biosynthesis glycosyltransferase
MNVRDVTLHLRFVPSRPHGMVRRALDLLISITAGILLSPALLLIALALWLPNGNPVLFVHTRIGCGGRPFRMYKFRKFHVTSGTDGFPLTIEGDNRMTAIGGFLAATKLDECPQLWNVIRGDMAIVGPRPESLAFADCFRDGREQVLSFRPGLLGPSQVCFRYESRLYPPGEDPTEYYRAVLFPAKARLDLGYFPQRTIASDLQWMVRGVLAISGMVPSPELLKAKTTLLKERRVAFPAWFGGAIEKEGRK